jgi:hypothetical protein
VVVREWETGYGTVPVSSDVAGHTSGREPGINRLRLGIRTADSVVAFITASEGIIPF